MAQTTWTVFLVGLAIYLAYLSAWTIATFVLALFLAHLLRPVVSFLDRLTPASVPRSVSSVAAYILILGMLIIGGGMAASAIGTQAGALTSRLPEILNKDLGDALPIPQWLMPYRAEIDDMAREQLRNLNYSVAPFVKALAMNAVAHAGSLLILILVPILAFFFLIDNGRMFRAMAELAPSFRDRVMVAGVMEDIESLLTNYMSALVGLSFSTFAFSLAFFQLAGVPYAVLLAGVGALLEVIPLAGPATAAVLTLGIAFVAGYPHLGWIIIFLALFRLFQDYLVSPYLMGQGVELHPLAVLFGVLAGEEIGGVVGMFFSIPVLAVIRIVFLAHRRSVIHRANDPAVTEEKKEAVLVEA